MVISSLTVQRTGTYKNFTKKAIADGEEKTSHKNFTIKRQ